VAKTSAKARGGGGAAAAAAAARRRRRQQRRQEYCGVRGSEARSSAAVAYRMSLMFVPRRMESIN